MSGEASKPAIQKRGIFGQYFGAITAENVEAEIKNVTGGWYALAGVQAFLIAVLFATGAPVLEFLAVPALVVVGAAFFRARKSRAVALAFLIYAASNLIFIFAAVAQTGSASGVGAGLVISILIALNAYRGVATSFAYHRLHAAQMQRRNVVIVTVAAVVAGAGLAFAVAALTIAVQPSVSDELAGVISLLAGFAAMAVVMGSMTRRYPFAVLQG